MLNNNSKIISNCCCGQPKPAQSPVLTPTILPKITPTPTPSKSYKGPVVSPSPSRLRSSSLTRTPTISPTKITPTPSLSPNSFNDTIFSIYSLSQKNPQYTGPVVKVRRSNDNAEKAFLANEIYGGQLESWVGVGNDGFITTWYDQNTYNNKDVIESSGTAPLRIIKNGSISNILFISDLDPTNKTVTLIESVNDSNLAFNTADVTGNKLYYNKVTATLEKSEFDDAEYVCKTRLTPIEMTFGGSHADIHACSLQLFYIVPQEKKAERFTSYTCDANMYKHTRQSHVITGSISVGQHCYVAPPGGGRIGFSISITDENTIPPLPANLCPPRCGGISIRYNSDRKDINPLSPTYWQEKLSQPLRNHDIGRYTYQSYNNEYPTTVSLINLLPSAIGKWKQENIIGEENYFILYDNVSIGSIEKLWLKQQTRVRAFHITFNGKNIEINDISRFIDFVLPEDNVYNYYTSKRISSNEYQSITLVNNPYGFLENPDEVYGAVLPSYLDNPSLVFGIFPTDINSQIVLPSEI
jgi:hypothetical protein